LSAGVARRRDLGDVFNFDVAVAAGFGSEFEARKPERRGSPHSGEILQPFVARQGTSAITSD
jgi:hypothetical protein